MRTFIAIDLPDPLKAQMETLQTEMLRALHPRGGDRALKWVDVQKVHLTLRFLGETDDRQREEIGHHLQRIVRDQPPFDLSLTGVGVFPTWPRLRVLWTGVGGEVENLKQLQAEVEQAAQACGFTAEDKDFSPHITLARTDRNASSQQIREIGEFLRRWAQTNGDRTWGAWRVDELIHMRSQLQPTGAVYTPLRRLSFVSDGAV